MQMISSYTNRALALGVALSSAAVVLTPAQAELFQFLWSPTARIQVSPTALFQTRAQVTVAARGYAVQFTPHSSEVFGPFPTSKGGGGLRVFGVDLRELGSEQLGLLSQPLPGIRVAGTDLYPGGVSPGFENDRYHWGDTTVNRLEWPFSGLVNASR
jgi:hypothetical protein